MNDNLLTVQEAARLRGVSRASIYHAIARGKLPYQRVLGRPAVLEEDVLNWDPAADKGGRPKGIPVNQETRRRISESQKKRWSKRKKES